VPGWLDTGRGAFRLSLPEPGTA